MDLVIFVTSKTSVSFATTILSAAFEPNSSFRNALELDTVLAFPVYPK